MYMVDWIQKPDDILKLNGRELLTHAGKISHEMAIQRSAEEYGKYQEEKRLISDTVSKSLSAIKQCSLFGVTPAFIIKTFVVCSQSKIHGLIFFATPSRLWIPESLFSVDPCLKNLS